MGTSFYNRQPGTKNKGEGLITSVGWQLFLFSFIATGFALIKGWSSFQSVLLGGGSWFIPEWYFLKRRQKVKSIFNDKEMLKAFFLSEFIKLVVSFGLIILLVLTCKIDRKSFLSGYGAMILIALLVSIGYGRKND